MVYPELIFHRAAEELLAGELWVAKHSRARVVSTENLDGGVQLFCGGGREHNSAGLSTPA